MSPHSYRGIVNITYIYLHLSVEAIVQQQVVGHADAVGLHGVSLAIIVIPDITWNRENTAYYMQSPKDKIISSHHFKINHHKIQINSQIVNAHIRQHEEFPSKNSTIMIPTTADYACDCIAKLSGGADNTEIGFI